MPNCDYQLFRFELFGLLLNFAFDAQPWALTNYERITKLK
jgi:hypothetical protein